MFCHLLFPDSNPSPPHPRGWPLSWVKQVVTFPEEKMLALRGIDATLYIRFLRGCCTSCQTHRSVHDSAHLLKGWFALLHTFTTFPVLFPIHVILSEKDSPASMTRASVSSLTDSPKGRSLLWVHLIIIFWISITWMMTLLWIAQGLMRMRAANLLATTENRSNQPKIQYRHPYPQYPFQPAVDPMMRVDDQNKGIRYRTVVVANIPRHLRDEQQLKEYFEYYLARKFDKPITGINTSTQPGFINRYLTYLWNPLRRIPPHKSAHPNPLTNSPANGHTAESSEENEWTAIVEQVTVVRRMSQFANLLERREEVLRVLETAHVRLACRVITAVATCIKDRSGAVLTKSRRVHQRALTSIKFWENEIDIENNAGGETRMDLLIRTICPFVKELSQVRNLPLFPRTLLSQKPRSADGEQAMEKDGQDGSYPYKTIWDALLSFPRSVLDPYQPLIHLNSWFRGKTVPTIDYYTAKLRFLTHLITEARSLPSNGYDPVSTAFVTFKTPKDARRACKHLAVHPDNPLACVVSMAPPYKDIYWARIMKLPYNLRVRTHLPFHLSFRPTRELTPKSSSSRAGLLVSVSGIAFWLVILFDFIVIFLRAFTVFWVFPVSLCVGLVSIQNISAFWPSLVRLRSQYFYVFLIPYRRKAT